MTSRESARPEGYYWVSDSGASPEIAELRDGDWWLVGCEEPVNGHALAVLGTRLPGPVVELPGQSLNGVHGSLPAGL